MREFVTVMVECCFIGVGFGGTERRFRVAAAVAPVIRREAKVGRRPLGGGKGGGGSKASGGGGSKANGEGGGNGGGGGRKRRRNVVQEEKVRQEVVVDADKLEEGDGDSDTKGEKVESSGFYTDSLKSYLAEIRRFEMLEHSEEVELARKVSNLVNVERIRDR